jgi:hypothetical protein
VVAHGVWLGGGKRAAATHDDARSAEAPITTLSQYHVDDSFDSIYSMIIRSVVACPFDFQKLVAGTMQ